MIEATRIFVGYDENEDRMFVDLSNAEGRCRLWLTRRIIRRLWSAMVDILERSSPTLSKAPADMRQEVIAFEHLSALSRPEPTDDGKGSKSVADHGTDLLHKVDINFSRDAFRLVFHSSTEPKAGLTVGRIELHKILALVDQCATAAEWDLGTETEWLQRVGPAGQEKLAS